MWHAHPARDFTGETPVLLIQTRSPPIAGRFSSAIRSTLSSPYVCSSSEALLEVPKSASSAREAMPPPASEVYVFCSTIGSSRDAARADNPIFLFRSEEHTSELQSLRHLVCR